MASAGRREDDGGDVLMATTSLWAIRGYMGTVIDYVENPGKTENPERITRGEKASETLDDVISYAGREEATNLKQLVYGMNVDPDHAREQMIAVKRKFGKEDGTIAYHGYQSFKEGEGEITAEIAHEIGVKLAQELWGDRFEVVVATHLNTGHYHNHIILNSVSFMDGYKFVRFKSDYRQMQMVSDRLCKEYKLHVMENPSSKRGKSYNEWQAERQGKMTVRGSIREDIDYAIRLSRSEKQFANVMKELGYEFKFFKKDGSYLEHPGLKPPGAKSYFRFRSLGPEYEYDSIRRRIIENTAVPGTPLLVERNTPKSLRERPNDTGLPGSYRRYCIRLYAFVTRPKQAKREYIPIALREDIAKLDRYIEQMDFLYQHKIEDRGSLQSKKEALMSELKEAIIERRKAYTVKERAVRNNNAPLIAQAKADISNISRKIREIRKQMSLCDAVAISSSRVIEGADAPTKQPEIEQPKPQTKKKHRY